MHNNTPHFSRPWPYEGPKLKAHDLRQEAVYSALHPHCN